MSAEEELLERVEAYEVMVGADPAATEAFLEARLAKILSSAPRGLPRPLWQGLPVPWVSQAEDLGDIDVFRRATAIFLRLCAVCGLALGDEATVYWRPIDRITIDGVAVHVGECAQLTETKCPSIRGLRRAGELETAVVATATLCPVDAGESAAESGMPWAYQVPGYQPSRSSADSPA